MFLCPTMAIVTKLPSMSYFQTAVQPHGIATALAYQGGQDRAARICLDL